MSRVRDKADFQFAGEDYTHGSGVKYVANMIQTTDLTASGTITDVHVQDLADIASVSASNDGHYLYYDHGTTSFKWQSVSSGSTLTIQDEGSTLSTDATTLNFVGTGVTASGTGATKTITINSGGGGSMNDVVDDSSPQLGGVLDTNGSNIEFGESANAGADDTLIFGTDFRIYKATSGNGIIQWTNNSTGMMQIISSRDIDIRAGNSDRITGRQTGAVDIYYAGVKKFETTNTGANIIGTLTTDGLTVDGNLTVNGTTTTINTTTLTVSDNTVVLNHDVTGTPSENSGIEVERGTSSNVSIRWNETTDKWQFTNDGSTYEDIGAPQTFDLVNDTTPQLGGNLDVNNNTIEYTFSLSGSSSPNYIFAGGNHFFSGATNNPTLYLTRGIRYNFANISSSHPFRIQSQNSAGGALYTSGVINNNGTGTVTFTPPMDAPGELYYYCNAHSSMNGTIKILGPSASTGDISFNASTISSSGTTVTVDDNLSVTGSITSSQAGAPILTSASSITLQAATNSRVHVNQSPLRLYNVTTTNRGNISAADGDIVYDSDLDAVFAFQNGSWVNIGGGGGGGSATDILTITTTSATPSAPSSGSVNIYEDGSTLTFQNSRAGTGHYQVKAENSSGTFLFGVDGLGNVVTGTTGSVRTKYFYSVTNTSYYMDPSSTSTALQLAGDMKTDASYVGSVKEVTSADTSTSGTSNFDSKDYEIKRLTQNQAANRTLNIRGDGSTTLDSTMSTNEIRTVAIFFKNGTTPYYISSVNVDGTSVTPMYAGGSAPTSGNASSTDFYTYSILKTGSGTFEVYGTVTQFA